MIQIEITNTAGDKGYTIRTSQFPDRLGGEIIIEVSRGDSAGEGMHVPTDVFFQAIDNFYKEEF